VKKLLTLPLALASAISPLASAEEENMEYVLVTATRSEQPGVYIPANMTVVDAAQIKLSGANTISEVLASQPGIQINDKIGDGNRGSSISLRGFGETAVNNVLVLMDGRKLNNPTLAGPDLSTISLKDVERIEIINGSAGVLYGDKAVGGVINIITKMPGKFSGNVEVTRGSWDFDRYRASVSQGFDNNFYYRISGEKRLANNYRKNNEANYENALFKAGYQSDTLHIFAEGQKIDDDLRFPGALTEAQIAVDRRQANTPNDFGDQNTDSHRFGTDISLTKNWGLLVEYTYRDTESKTGFDCCGDTNSSTNLKTFNPRLIGNYPVNDSEMIITLGSDIQDSQFKYTNVSMFCTANESFSQDMEDYYAQVVYPINADVITTLGARQTDVNDIDDSTNVEIDRDETLYSAGVSWTFSDLGRIYLRYDESVRWATVDENCSLFGTGCTFLDPQLGESIELGYEIHTNFADISATVYQLSLEDDLSVTYHINDQWSVYADAQYTGNQYRAGDEANGQGELGGYTLFNANIRWENNHWYGQLRLNNITSKEYLGFASTQEQSWIMPGLFVNSGYPAPEANAQLTIGYQF
jgi:iron complex outermembrane receptor protein